MSITGKYLFNIGLLLAQETAYKKGIIVPPLAEFSLTEDLLSYYNRMTPEEEEDLHYFTGERKIVYSYGDDKEW